MGLPICSGKTRVKTETNFRKNSLFLQNKNGHAIFPPIFRGAKNGPFVRRNEQIGLGKMRIFAAGKACRFLRKMRWLNWNRNSNPTKKMRTRSQRSDLKHQSFGAQ
jgi:hypothetical protein